MRYLRDKYRDFGVSTADLFANYRLGQLQSDDQLQWLKEMMPKMTVNSSDALDIMYWAVKNGQLRKVHAKLGCRVST